MSETRISEDDPNYEKFIEEAELPYEDISETKGFQVYKLNGSSGIAVYRKFQMDGELPGTEMESDQFHGLEVERMSDERYNVMLVKSEGGDNVFEYRGGEMQPENVFNFGAIGTVRNLRVKDMLTPDH